LKRLFHLFPLFARQHITPCKGVIW
jgi:hypothetical protein